MPSYGPSSVLDHCVCGVGRKAHEPSEAYYREQELEGRMTSSTALRATGCREHRPSGVTLSEVMRRRNCERRWRDVRMDRVS